MTTVMMMMMMMIVIIAHDTTFMYTTGRENVMNIYLGLLSLRSLSKVREAKISMLNPQICWAL
jgi:hypothetical protein